MSLYDSQEISEDLENVTNCNKVNEPIDADFDKTESVAERTNKKSNAAKRKKKRKIKSFIKEAVSFILIIIAAFIVAVIINIYVVRTSHVEGPSMNPTLENGQNVLISRMPYLFGEPERGDIVVFDSSKTKRTFFLDIKEALRDNALTGIFVDNSAQSLDEQFYIKRVIGIPGDVITVKDAVMYINEQPLTDEGYSVLNDGTAYYQYEGMTWIVEPGDVFVMGDNRNNSKDSRKIGCIPIDCIMGKVIKE